MERLSEQAKIDAGIKPQSTSSAQTGDYYSMAGFRRAVLTLIVGGTIAQGNDVALEILQAEDEGGTNSKAVNDLDSSAIKAAISSADDVTEATLKVDTASTGDSVDINGVTFTSASSTDSANQEFDGSGTTDNEASELASVVNDYFDDIEASASSSTVTFTAVEPGEALLTIENIASNFTVNTTKAVAYVDVDASLMDINNGFTHIAPKVDPDVTAVIATNVLRYDARISPDQKVAASQLE